MEAVSSSLPSSEAIQNNTHHTAVIEAVHVPEEGKQTLSFLLTSIVKILKEKVGEEKPLWLYLTNALFHKYLPNPTRQSVMEPGIQDLVPDSSSFPSWAILTCFMCQIEMTKTVCVLGYCKLISSES